MAIIELNNIGKVFRTREIETTALENVNLSVEKGEFLSIMGPSGCGKSTLLNIVGLLDNPTTGTVRIMTPTAPPFPTPRGHASATATWASCSRASTLFRRSTWPPT